MFHGLTYDLIKNIVGGRRTRCRISPQKGAWFHLTDHVNTHYTRHWEGNHKEVFQHQLHQEKIGIWCAVFCNRIVKAILFEPNYQ